MAEAAGKSDQKLIDIKNSPGRTLLLKIKKGELSPDDLTPAMRRACVRVLRYAKGWLQGDIAEYLHCSVPTIRRDYRKIEADNLSQMAEFDIRREFIETITRLEIYEQNEIAQGHPTKAANIRIGRINLLQSFGFLPKDLGTLKIQDARNQKKETEIIDLEGLTEEQQVAVDRHWDEILKIIGEKGQAAEGPKALNP